MRLTSDAAYMRCAACEAAAMLVPAGTGDEAVVLCYRLLQMLATEEVIRLLTSRFLRKNHMHAWVGGWAHHYSGTAACMPHYIRQSTRHARSYILLCVALV